MAISSCYHQKIKFKQMKKIVLYSLGIVFSILLFSSCKASKKGCGLTSDANKIEQTTSNNANFKAEV